MFKTGRPGWVIWIGLLVFLLLLWLFGMPLVERMTWRLERTAFEQVIRQLNSACADRLIEGKAEQKVSLRDWIGRNPMQCLEQQALSGINYLETETQVELQPEGSWMFESTTASLRYRWQYPQQLVSLGPQQDVVRYRLAAEFADSNQNGTLDDDEAINGFYLQPVDRFIWRDWSEN